MKTQELKEIYEASPSESATQKYKKTKKGLISTIYGQQRSSSRERGMDEPDYNNSDLQEWCMAQQKFHDLYDIWVALDYYTNNKPSIDRLDDSKPYTLCNIQMMSWGDNKRKHEQQVARGEKEHKVNPHKTVLQLNKDGSVFNEYFSVREASRQTGIQQSNISHVCNGNCGFKTAGGFKWKFKQ